MSTAENPTGPNLDTTLDRMKRASNFLSNAATFVSEYGHNPVQTIPTYMRAAESMLEEAREAFVGMMRAGGASWADVGEALNITRQAAQQRFGARS